MSVHCNAKCQHLEEAIPLPQLLSLLFCPNAGVVTVTVAKFTLSLRIMDAPDVLTHF